MKIILFYIFHVFYKLLASLLLTFKVHTVIQVDDLISHLPLCTPDVSDNKTRLFSLQGNTFIARVLELHQRPHISHFIWHCSFFLNIKKASCIFIFADDLGPKENSFNIFFLFVGKVLQVWLIVIFLVFQMHL